jgi:hypothetical protein
MRTSTQNPAATRLDIQAMDDMYCYSCEHHWSSLDSHSCDWCEREGEPTNLEALIVDEAQAIQASSTEYIPGIS